MGCGGCGFIGVGCLRDGDLIFRWSDSTHDTPVDPRRQIRTRGLVRERRRDLRERTTEPLEQDEGESMATFRTVVPAGVWRRPRSCFFSAGVQSAMALRPSQ